MKRVLIVGASRGIGLGLVEAHLESGWEVHTTTRDGTAPRNHPNLGRHRLDVLNPHELEHLVEELTEPMSRIIHNAGINHAPREELFAVNTDAPIRVVQSLLDASSLVPDGVVAIMSSNAGSRAARRPNSGDYGDSKAALNDEFRRRADDWHRKGAVAIVMHPGWVRTDMGGPAAPVTLDDSVAGIMSVLDGLGSDNHGQFLTWEGNTLPW